MIRTKLSDLLLRIETYEWDHFLYVPKSGELSLNTCVLVLSEDEDSEVSEANQFVTWEDIEYNCCLNVADVQDIVSNLMQQVPDCKEPMDLMLKAMKHYLRNDAFIVVSA